MADKYPDEWTTRGSIEDPFDDDRAEEETLQSLSLQPSNNPSPVLTLPIKYTNFVGNHIHIFPSSAPNTQPIYTADIRMTKPHITLSTPSPNPRKIGEINYHLLTTRIDATINNTSLPLTMTSKLKCHYTFSSPALEGRKLTWRFRKWTSTDLVCVDEEAGVVLARFHFGGFHWMKKGQLEIFAPQVASKGSVVEGGSGRALLEELVWTCVGLVNLYVVVTYTAIA